MPPIDLNVMRTIVERMFVPEIYRAFGDPGTLALRNVIEVIKEIYRYIEPENWSGELVVFKTLDGSRSEQDRHSGRPDRNKIIGDARLLSVELQPNTAIEISDRGEFILWDMDELDLSDLSEKCIVYVYCDRTESFYVRGEHKPILNPGRIHASVFALPTFRELIDALEDFKARHVRASGCLIFYEVWDDEKRIFLRQKPEKTMRRALHQYLRSVLRDAEVRPEQIVDETHPVDIKVTWTLTNRIALIEIKWLGQSVNSDGHFKTAYSAGRAREGAKQLAEYLDENYSMVTSHVSRGYLVIFDARRRCLKKNMTEISHENGFYYALEEIEYEPDYYKNRSDFDLPVRMFAEPICAPN